MEYLIVVNYSVISNVSLNARSDCENTEESVIDLGEDSPAKT